MKISEADMDAAFRAETQIKHSKFYRLFRELAHQVMWTGDEPLYEVTESKLLFLMGQVYRNPIEWLNPEKKGESDV